MDQKPLYFPLSFFKVDYNFYCECHIGCVLCDNGINLLGRMANLLFQHVLIVWLETLN